LLGFFIYQEREKNKNPISLSLYLKRIFPAQSTKRQLFMKKCICTSFTLAAFSIGTLAQLPSYVPKNSLAGWWSFSGNAKDSSGNSHHGVVTGAALTTDRFGNTNRAYHFINSADNIGISSIHQTNVLKYSIAGWFLKENASEDIEGTIFCGSNPCNAPGGLRLLVGTTNQAAFGAEYQTCSSVWAYTKDRNYTDNEWHHFVATFNAVPGLISWTNFKIYIDDTLVSEVEYNQGNPSAVIAPINNLNLPTIIGNSTDLGSGFQGKLDDIGVWNRVLTRGEINHLYNSTQGYVGINVTKPVRNLHVKDVLRLEPRQTAPSSAAKGDIYFDGVLNKLRVFDGSVWQNCW
jgi:hypothetical protein